MPRRAGAVALLVVGALAGCGARDRGGADAGSPYDAVGPVHGRRCAFVMDAEEVPGFDDLVRVGTRGSLALWGRGAAVGDSVLLSVRYDDEGRLAWVQTIGGNTAPERLVELERIVRSAVVEDGPADWGVRVRFVGGRVDEVLSSVLCQPARTSSREVVATPVGTGREMAELYSSLGRRLKVEVALDDKGRVVDARLPFSSGSRLLDQYVLDLARAALYDPKLHDGIGVPSVLTISVNYRRRI